MKRRLVLIISLVAGLVAAILTRVYISVTESELNAERERLRKKYGTINVLAFAKDTPAGTVIAKRDLGVKTVPALGMRGQALTEDNLADIIGRKTTVAHGKEEVLFWSDIEGGNPNAGGLSSDVKKQMRAMSINVSGAAAVAGMIKPNDHVDVIGTFNFPGDDGKLKRGDPVTCTILQNVLVLATGRETSKSRVREAASSGSGYSTVTLEVSPREAEMLAFAEQIKGRIILTLRNRNDTSSEKELPQIDYEAIRSEMEELNLKRQQKLGAR
ncbi:MAG: Flp pilus assembly protein CpaB [Kiritimatiellae bacterium]|nr:Flp pilus assembly protein CpaB [Kiritimatiellia bacterium]